MGGEESSSSPPQIESETPSVSASAAASSSSSSSSSGAPVRVLLYFHKAFRAELDHLLRLSSDVDHSCMHQRAAELDKRLHFFRTVFTYHCAAEDEVIFFALDARVKNIACTYFLEHHIIDSLFGSIFSCLSAIKQDHENPCQQFQQLSLDISTLQGSLCQHMAKEEQQVFPLLVNNFSDEEQGLLLWQLVCSVPVVLMEDLFLWLACFLAPGEQLDLKHTLRRVVPQDKLLQEVVISWIDKTTQPPSGDCLTYDESSECPNEVDSLKDISKLCLFKTSFDEGCQSDFHVDVKDSPFDGLMLWHAALRSEFKDILDKLYKIGSKKFSSLASLLIRINFLTDVLIFYSGALERIFYPLLEGACVLQTSLSYKAFPCKNEIEGFQKMIFEVTQINFANPRFFKMLCNKMEDLVLATSKHLFFQETKVFPLINKKYDRETQQKLLFRSLCILPLGLLKCVATWFSSHLPKDKLKFILDDIKQSRFLARPFASLLHKWIRIGYSGKFTMEDLQEMFNRRLSYMFEQFREGKDLSNKLEHALTKNSSLDSSSFFYHSFSRCFQQIEKHGTLYSSGINMLVFSSRALNQVYSISEPPIEAVSANYREPRPMDHIYYFHKAIKKDLESLVLDSTKLSKNLEFFVEFNRHFRLVRSLYELHSETEDQVAFPALEAKQKIQNLTQSYSIDHKLEDGCFNRVSGILDQMTELYDMLSGSGIDEVGPTSLKYRQLCSKLQDSCKLLEKILNDHIHREEIELWPLFREHFSTEEQEKIVGYMLGRTRAEILQKMIVWLMDSLTSEELQAMMNCWRKVTKYTKFDEWLGDWWEGMESNVDFEVEKPEFSSSSTAGSPHTGVRHSTFVSHYQRKFFNGNTKFPHDEAKTINMVKRMEGLGKDNKKHKSFEYKVLFNEEKHRKDGDLTGSLSELEAAIRKVSQESSLDLPAKTRIMQDLMTSHCVAQSPPDSNRVITSESGKLAGQLPSYRDAEGSIFGCKHYKQNCKLVAACCNQIFTCRRCHDEVSDHLMERKSTTQMMCMLCLEIQPIGPTCLTPSCNKYSMARYYCKHCRLFDDNREIYHCPYCNLCRLGKGLGIDYFHCMKCNACMSRTLSSTHICREKCIEDKCPICHEDMFTSSDPVKALACGHLMHSSCFEEYTCMRYTCPVCSKSLGDMQVLFGMLDALLAEERTPEEHIGQTQDILCNDCEKKGAAPFHRLYHKCPFCGSYNTRLL